MAKTRQKGFSLVELLVVIAIILVLIALLLPMTLRLEDNVNVMIDINNFRNIYEAMYSYAEDNKGHIPHHQATKELGYYSCRLAWGFWSAKLGLDNSQRGTYVGCSGHSSAGYVEVIGAYKDYVDSHNCNSVFYCHSPKAGVGNGGTNYSFRTSNSCGAHGTDGPPGGWIIGTHNSKAHIVTDGGFGRSAGWQVNWDENKKRSPFEIIYGGGRFREPWRHMANRYPRLRLDGSAEAIIYREEWNSSRTIQGGWYAGSGGM